ncbi:hypothetical protein M9435_006132 [Picochlorum sp. BPE23]|nr:hypothetical protein M9435_006132 [Picochlorum sp. BPE23]
MAVPGIPSRKGCHSSVTSYKIHLNASEGLYTPLEHRMGQWVEENQMFSFSTLAVLIISGRHLNVLLMSFIGYLIDSKIFHVVLLHALGVFVTLSALVGMINPSRSPHKAISGLYYRAVSSVFVPRFVKSSVWSVSDADIEWKLFDRVPNRRISSSKDSCNRGEDSASSSSSHVRSFRLPDSHLSAKNDEHPYRRSLDLKDVDNLQNGDYRSHRARAMSEGGSLLCKIPWRIHTGSKSVTSEHPSGASTPLRSPRKHRRKSRKRQWEPKMLRITSGQELNSMKSGEETVATRLLNQGQDAIPEESPLSPAASIDSSSSFSRSVSDYVDSWLQSLKSGMSLSETPPPPYQRLSLDGHGAHRHYTRGSVKARDSAIHVLNRYAEEAQAQAKKSLIAPMYHPAATVLDSIGLDGDCPDDIRSTITDEHLLQLGDLFDEAPCTKILEDLGIEKACESQASLFGIMEGDFCWEQSTSEVKDGLEMVAKRMVLRHGLYMYKTCVRIHGVDPHDVRPFHLDDQARSLWDDSAIAVERDKSEGCNRVSRHAESCLHRYISKFPRPLSARSYQYARRVWTRPSDGGCYAISKSCTLPSGNGQNKYVLVKEYISGCRIRRTEDGTEILTVYFEDSQVRPGLAKMAVPKGLWPFWAKYESSLRVFAKAKQVNHGRRSLDALDRHDAGLQAANDQGSDYDSDDEVYDALARLKERKKRLSSDHNRLSNDVPRWIRRVLLAGVLKVLHESISK